MGKRGYETWRIWWKDSIYVCHLRGIIRKDMVENPPEVMKNTNQQIQKTQKYSNKITENHTYTITVKEYSTKEKTSKPPVGKCRLPTKAIRVTTNLSTIKARQWNDISKMLKENNYLPRILYQANVFLEWRWNKNFSG